MRILFVLHDLSLTGAPKIGLQMAELFAEQAEVYLVARQDGPLRDQVSDAAFSGVVVDDNLHESVHEDRLKRIEYAVSLIKEIQPDLVYANSIASGDWVTAAKDAGVPCVLHIHEMKEGMLALQRNDLYNPYDFESCVYTIFASQESLRDFQRLFGHSEHAYNFGVGVDVAGIERLSLSKPDKAVNVFGQALSKKKTRKRIVMCGTAVPRKGSDLFWEVAKALSQYDFLWVGGWNDDDFVQFHNHALKQNKKEPLRNLYWTNTTSNPYPALKTADLFALTSREDPNPLVVLESMTLGIPVVAFCGTGSSHHLTSKYGYTLSGEVNAERLAKFCDRLLEVGGGDGIAKVPDTIKTELDLSNKTFELYQLISEVVNPS